MTDQIYNNFNLPLELANVVSGGRVELPSGTTTLTSRNSLGEGLLIEGKGAGSILYAQDQFGEDIGTNRMYGEEGDFMLLTSGASENGAAYATNKSKLIIRNLTLDGNGSNQFRKVNGLGIANFDWVILENVFLRNFGQLNESPTIQTDEASGDRTAFGILIKNCNNVTIQNVFLEDSCGIKVALSKKVYIGNVHNITGSNEAVILSSCQETITERVSTKNSESSAVYVDDAYSGVGGESKIIVVDGVAADTITQTGDYDNTWYSPGVYAEDTTDIKIVNGVWRNCSGQGIYLKDCDNYIIDNNTILNANADDHDRESISTNGGGQWTQSTVTTEYYYTGAMPTGEPTYVWFNEVLADEGTLGSLSAGQWAWGDNDSLGYNVLYVRISGGDPDGQATGYIKYSRGSANVAGVLIDGTTTKGIVSLASCEDDRTTKLMEYGIYVKGTCSNLIMNDNNTTSMKLDGFNVRTASSSNFAKNHAYTSGRHGFNLKSISNSVVGSNSAGNSGRHGMYLDVITKSTITGNRAYNSGQGNISGYENGIELNGACSGNVITANRCYDDQATKTQEYGMKESSTSNSNLIVANNFEGNNTEGFTASLTGSLLSERHSNLGMKYRYLRRLAYVKNQTGSTTAVGQVAIHDTASTIGDEADVSSGAGSIWVWGLWAEAVANNEYGFIQTEGRFVDALVTGTLSAGAILSQSSTSGRLGSGATSGHALIAQLLEANASGTGAKDVNIIQVRTYP